MNGYPSFYPRITLVAPSPGGCWVTMSAGCQILFSGLWTAPDESHGWMSMTMMLHIRPGQFTPNQVYWDHLGPVIADLLSTGPLRTSFSEIQNIVEPLYKGHPRGWPFKRGGLSWGVKYTWFVKNSAWKWAKFWNFSETFLAFPEGFHCTKFSIKKIIWKCCLQNVSHFVPDSISPYSSEYIKESNL